MRNFTIYLAGLLCLFVTDITAQTFETRAKAIADKIEQITKEEKAALKSEVEWVNEQLEKGEITSEEADEKKLEFAETRAKNIETRTAGAQEQLRILVQEQVDGKIIEKDTTGRRIDLVLPGFKIRDSRKTPPAGEYRTTSQFVIASGFNNLITNNSIAHSDFGYLRSVFWEWGVTWNSRILKDNNLLHFKYGVTGVYNHLAPTENRYFVDNGSETVLETSPHHLRKKDSYFKNVFVTIPLHLEFDFSKTEEKDGQKIFRTHKGFRFGIGGFVGYNTNSKQILNYKESGYRIKEKTKGNFNVDDWNYGLSGYIGYKELSLYMKYDLNPMFKNNSVDQHNISLGLRFDLN
ncbi:MAG: hypothetical protein ITG00_04325 [Flavobacterium sp.]|nr:hypothetical protein [Flavobacterium sp.]